ncbi:DUF5805 domain-containing protein [Natronomonas sp.]|uniref:DUF5805 domain-containing protein n=1 Tax=Natronomonas sp. TaxID=2184060 RepID=UPI0037CAC363
MAKSGDRVSVQTYVTSAQRNRWQREAEKLDMSQAEYVRTMVQAGRRGFDLNIDRNNLNSSTSMAVKAETTNPTPGVDDLHRRILDVLDASEFADWDALLAGVTDDIEERLDDTLDELQSEDRIRYSGRHGGYTVVDDGR